jgi:hypothetical protein
MYTPSRQESDTTSLLNSDCSSNFIMFSVTMHVTSLPLLCALCYSVSLSANTGRDFSYVTLVKFSCLCFVFQSKEYVSWTHNVRKKTVSFRYCNWSHKTRAEQGCPCWSCRSSYSTIVMSERIQLPLANEPNKATWPAKDNVASWRAKLTDVLDFITRVWHYLINTL